jgi:hypothetical protein
VQHERAEAPESGDADIKSEYLIRPSLNLL